MSDISSYSQLLTSKLSKNNFSLIFTTFLCLFDSPRETIYASKKNSHPVSYAMHSDPCTVIKNGTRCACSRGLFSLGHEVNFELSICKPKTCNHLLKGHWDADDEPPPTESAPTDSSTSAGNPNHTQRCKCVCLHTVPSESIVKS